MRIGFIGLGIMGQPMAGNLLDAGHRLSVYNRTPEKARPLVARGAHGAQSPAEAAGDAQVLFTMLAHPPAVRAAALGAAGFLSALPAGALWVDSSTVHPSFSREMARTADRAGIHFLDAPVSGTRAPAESGDLLFLVGGAAEDVERARPLFSAMGRRVVHVGEVGMGTSLKMVINLLLAVAMASFSEGVALGRALGISQDVLADVLLDGPVVAPFVRGKWAKIEAGDDVADFPLRWMRKDLHLASTTAYERAVPLPLGGAAKEIYTIAQRAGLGEADFSAVLRFLVDQADQEENATDR